MCVFSAGTSVPASRTTLRGVSRSRDLIFITPPHRAILPKVNMATRFTRQYQGNLSPIAVLSSHKRNSMSDIATGCGNRFLVLYSLIRPEMSIAIALNIQVDFVACADRPSIHHPVAPDHFIQFRQTCSVRCRWPCPALFPQLYSDAKFMCVLLARGRICVKQNSILYTRFFSGAEAVDLRTTSSVSKVYSAPR